ncbi:MAG TPA: hypothetical protein GXX18_00985 [Bacillales bacterium]|nr:hypothetical protein [Bacillales bacterium]
MAKSNSFLYPKWKDAALSMLGSVPMKGVIKKKGAQALKKASKASEQSDKEGTNR